VRDISNRTQLNVSDIFITWVQCFAQNNTWGGQENVEDRIIKIEIVKSIENDSDISTKFELSLTFSTI
jgi:hypothetical protein